MSKLKHAIREADRNGLAIVDGDTLEATMLLLSAARGMLVSLERLGVGGQHVRDAREAIASLEV